MSNSDLRMSNSDLAQAHDWYGNSWNSCKACLKQVNCADHVFETAPITPNHPNTIYLSTELIHEFRRTLISESLRLKKLRHMFITPKYL